MIGKCSFDIPKLPIDDPLQSTVNGVLTEENIQAALDKVKEQSPDTRYLVFDLQCRCAYLISPPDFLSKCRDLLEKEEG
jgi:hypothetical protein